MRAGVPANYANKNSPAHFRPGEKFLTFNRLSWSMRWLLAWLISSTVDNSVNVFGGMMHNFNTLPVLRWLAYHSNE